MAQRRSKQVEIEEVLISAVEVELAALKAAVDFWTQWARETSKYVEAASKTVGKIRTSKRDAPAMLLEVVDAGRESLRVMTELPKRTAESFLHNLKRTRSSRMATRRARAKP